MQLILVIFLLFLPVVVTFDRVVASTFTVQTICNMEQRISDGCSTKVSSRLSGKLNCIALCDRQTSCMGVTWTENRTCIIHETCPLVEPCTEGNSELMWSRYNCVHGSWSRSENNCTCFLGYWGSRCENFPRDCVDVHAAGGQGDVPILMDPFQNGRPRLVIPCKITGNEILARMYVTDGNVDRSFLRNRTWSEYVNGFRFNDVNTWQGLASWHHITQSPNCRTMSMKLVVAQTILRRVYEGVIVGDEDDKYSLTFNRTWRASENGRFGIGIGNCLEGLQNVSFSTWDADNENVTSDNCAARAGFGGWWNDTCDNPCNFLGEDLRNRDPNVPEWESFFMSGVDMQDGLLTGHIEFFYVDFECK